MAKSIGWAFYAAGFAIWLLGYLSGGHAAAFDWDAAAPSWISSFVPNLEAEVGFVIMFASMIPIYWRAGRKRASGCYDFFLACRPRGTRYTRSAATTSPDCLSKSKSWQIKSEN